ncbi:DUF3489 domain-containing protein [Yoonia sp.]|uniref:DUF3489 domain-containing protein n=1 Tax=Yoonia sp. TaxID=2212373 RepID=UPI002E04982F|nr:DUF3489 domain-containing protein [Yoonia sp.]
MTQIQLSDAQTTILSTACARDDGLVFPVTAPFKGGAVGNICKSLLKQRLIEEVVAADHNTVWRHDADRGPITLRATPQAQVLLGMTQAPETAETTAPLTLSQHRASKQDMLIAMLRADGGATIAEITTALGWQPHTARGVISGVLKKKLGLKITSQVEATRGRIYSLPDTEVLSKSTTAACHAKAAKH